MGGFDMADKKPELLSAGKIGKEIGASAAKVKKAIETLSLEPANIRCGCKYYDKAQVQQIKKTIEG